MRAHLPIGLTVFFDLTENGFPWWRAIGPLMLVVFGFGVAVWSKAASTVFRGWMPNHLRAFGILFGVLATLSGASSLWTTWQGYRALSAAYSGHRYETIEGTLTNVHRDYGGHGIESFDVGGRHISYRTSREDVAFHGAGNEVSMLNGRRVQVFLVGPDIIRIEVLSYENSKRSPETSFRRPLRVFPAVDQRRECRLARSPASGHSQRLMWVGSAPGPRTRADLCPVCRRADVPLALRHSLIELASARQAGEGQLTKMEMIYRYLNGPAFRHRVEAIVEKFTDMQADLDRERRTMTRLWAKREVQIRGVIEATAGMYGDLQGIAEE